MPEIVVKFGAVDHGTARSGQVYIRRLIRQLKVSTSLQHGGEPLLNHRQSRHRLGNALAGQIPEITGLVDFNLVLLDLQGEPALIFVFVLERRVEGLGIVIDTFGRLQDRLRGLFHAMDRGSQFAGGAHHAPFLTFAHEGHELALVAGNDSCNCASSRSSASTVASIASFRRSASERGASGSYIT